MNTVSPNAEVWVIHENQAILFRRHDQHWQKVQSTPFCEFLGSAAALSSFTLPDTVVYLNLTSSSSQAIHSGRSCWVGVAQDPLRLIEIEDAPLFTQHIRDIRSMGKSVRVVCAEHAHGFESGVQMMQMNPQELDHLKHWLKREKTGVHRLRSASQLYGALWLKAESNYQGLRVAALVCTVLSVVAMQWSAEFQIQQQSKQMRLSMQRAAVAGKDEPRLILLNDWSTQINKFGKGNRANIQALSMQWTQNGDVYSHAVLARDRKRVPKGCVLDNPLRVQCITKADSK